MDYNLSAKFALEQDQKDPLSQFREKFHIPQHNNAPCLYFTGNSLGLQPKSTADFITQELSDWKNLGVEGHFKGRNPWFEYHKFTKASMAKILGAKPSEVILMNSLTTNLHLMMVSFYRPTDTRFKIICEAGAFPSDQYAFESQARFHGLEPQEVVIELHPRDGEETLRTEDIVGTIDVHKNELALVILSGVQYYTGQFFDLQAITKAGHQAGAKVGFDLAHAAGNVPLQLHDHNVDFAVWCTYKYLNSGPGAVAGAFIHEKYSQDSSLPRFSGWWGHSEDERFLMKKGFKPMAGADSWQLSNINILTTAAVWASLEIFDEAGMQRLREKSIRLTGYLEFLLNLLNEDEQKLKIITPLDPDQRGCQLSIVMKKNGKHVFDFLTENGVIADWREPNVIRVAPMPLYNSFQDIFCLFHAFKTALA